MISDLLLINYPIKNIFPIYKKQNSNGVDKTGLKGMEQNKVWFVQIGDTIGTGGTG